MYHARLRHEHGGDPVEVTVERSVGGGGATVYRVRVDERTVELPVEGSPAAGRLRVDGRVLPFRTARLQDRIEVWLAGRIYRF